VTVVVAEPSRVQASIIRKYLQSPAAEEVFVAGSGREALELVLEKKPAVLVCSMHLPDMTAVDLARLLRADPVGAGVGLVVVTSQSDAARNADLRPIDRKVVLYKPFDQAQLIRVIAKVAGQPVATAPGSLTGRVEELQGLIVDDSSAARAHERLVLTNLGFRHLSESKDGLEAVGALSEKRFHLIVTDDHIPNMDGLELIRFIRQKKECSAVPILMVTSETDPMLHEQAFRAGASAVCEKSFKPEVVRRLLTRLLLGEAP
jgi:two-component system chemotaxis response regulator CheY